MSTYIANVEQWENFEKETRILFRDKNVTKYHAKELIDSHGDFRKWGVREKGRFADDFGDIINRTLEVGCSAILKDVEYDKYYKSGPRAKKLPQDTKYGVCFRAILSFTVEALFTWKSDVWPKDEKSLNIVLEQGHKNSGDALRLFETLKSALRPEHSGLLGTISFASKNNCLPLAAADNIAYSSWKIEKGIKKKSIDLERPSKVHQSYKGHCYRLEVGKESLMALKRNLLIEDAARFLYGAKRQA